MEPAACAIHGMDKLNAAVGVDVLIIGAGPTGFYFRVPYHFLTWVERLSLTGLILAQLLKLNGAAKVVIAANKGIKTEIAKQLDAGDVYIELDRNDPKEQWDKIKSDYPHGFDIVVRVIYLFVKKKNTDEPTAFTSDRSYWVGESSERCLQFHKERRHVHDIWGLFR